MRNLLELMAVGVIALFVILGVGVGILIFWSILFALEVGLYTIFVYPIVKFIIPIFAPNWIVATWGLLESVAFSTVLATIVTFAYFIIKKLKS